MGVHCAVRFHLQSDGWQWMVFVGAASQPPCVAFIVQIVCGTVVVTIIACITAPRA